MIQVTFLDGLTVTVNKDDFASDAATLSIGASWFAPLSAIRYWEVIDNAAEREKS